MTVPLTFLTHTHVRVRIKGYEILDFLIFSRESKGNFLVFVPFRTVPKKDFSRKTSGPPKRKHPNRDIQKFSKITK